MPCESARKKISVIFGNDVIKKSKHLLALTLTDKNKPL